MSPRIGTPWRRYVPIGLIVSIGCALSVVAVDIVDRLERERAEAQFNQAAADRIFAIQRTVDTHLEVLRSIVAFYNGSNFVDRGEFATFVGTALTRYPSIHALEWAPRISAAERAEHEAQTHQEGFSGYRITERTPQGRMQRAGERPAYSPVYYVEPFAGNQVAFGFDLASNPTRRAASSP